MPAARRNAITELFFRIVAAGGRAQGRELRTGYDMANHAVASGSHAQALDAEFIHRFEIAGPMDEALTRFREIRDSGIDFVRVVPGSRDMPREVGGASIQALGKLVTELASATHS